MAVSLISWRTRPEDAIALIDEWIHAPEVRELVEADGGAWPTGDLSEVVEALAQWSTSWDFRGGQSRLIFKTGDESRTDARAEQIYAAGRRLGLIDSDAPTMTSPDHLLLLGGLATGVKPRVSYAADLVRAQAVTPEAVAALGSFRRIHEREQPIAETYAPNARFEIDLLQAMMDASFGPADWWHNGTGDPDGDPARATLILRADGSPSLASYAAASGAPEERSANTADTYLQYAHDVRLKPGDKLLLVTSAIYRPYQHLDAVRTLGLEFGVEIETIGVPLDPGAAPSHPPSGYLQEIRSFFRSANLLLSSLSP